MFFDSRHHSPKEFIRIKNFKKIIFLSWYRVPWSSNKGQNFHSIAFLGMSKSSRKIFFGTILLQWLVPSYKQKSKQKNRVISPQHLKNWKILIFSDLRLYQACPRTQIFTLSQFFGMTESSWKIFFVTTLFHRLAPSCTQKFKPQKLLISSQTTF